MTRSHRVGAHRTADTPGWPWWGIALAAIAAVVALTAAGIFALDMLRPQSSLPSASESAAPEVITNPAEIDPSVDASISVLDASGEEGLAAGVGQSLEDIGWDVTATGGSTEEQATTVVWYEGEELAAVARGLVQGLGVGEAALSDGRISGSPITIVLGADAPGTVPSVEPREDGGVDHSGTPAP